MGDIKDFHCTYDNSAGIMEAVMKETGLAFPDVYLQCDKMAALSKALKAHDNAVFCELPFCHTVEAEAMGGVIHYGNERTGPRAGAYICTSMEQVLELPDIEFTKGRIHQVLLACRKLREQGEQVVLKVSGPFTILNVLLDARFVFKTIRRDPKCAKQVFDKLGVEILRFMEEAKKYGVQLISYADASAGVNILGPKMAAQIVELFTYDFLKKAERIADGEMLVLLCPKTTFALLGTGKAELVDTALPCPMEYGEACVQSVGKIKFAGQTCINNIHYMLETGMIKEVKLL